ncbi:DUF1444 family protein [Ammoniphilus resinae]|uniref:Uncharacterized protein YtpQ (UPF0354 family) n=1 Tax=Ammoniphilus resinae TaxID=861532 RepID=A0ABS4GKB5_9BACL|nr:DUF1444 family protein [Ammoniphilus resinae]MBP1930547.1 uncharacterized protein YtpQ (UPF0354 family) [Ammoniphilus resinae]
MNETQIISNVLEQLKKRLDSNIWVIEKKEEQIQIKQKEKTHAGLSLSIPVILSKIGREKPLETMEEFLSRVEMMANASLQEISLKGNEDRIYPVIRSRSHPTDKQGTSLLHKYHTAESTIFYAFDLGNTYRLIDQQMIDQSQLTEEKVEQMAIANLKKLDTSYKEDIVGDNTFYFFSQTDGYAASRVLNDELLSFMRRKVQHDMGVAIPHQDVLIIADLKNEIGFKVFSRLNMDFCMKGNIPISPLPFLYTEKQELEPIMILSNPGAEPHIVRKDREE